MKLLYWAKFRSSRASSHAARLIAAPIRHVQQAGRTAFDSFRKAVIADVGSRGGVVSSSLHSGEIRPGWGADLPDGEKRPCNSLPSPSSAPRTL